MVYTPSKEGNFSSASNHSAQVGRLIQYFYRATRISDFYIKYSNSKLGIN
jgi:hypothetical protein